MKVLIVLAALVAVALASQKRYDGYQVYEVKPRDEAGHQALVKMSMESSNYDFWTRPRGVDRTTDVMVPPAFASRFVAALNAFNIQYRITHTNVQELIDESMKDVAAKRLRKDGRASVTWDAYYPYEDIMQFVDDIEAAYPNLVTVDRSLEPTYEGRITPVLKISSNNDNKKAIFVDGGIHAREWLSPAWTTWLINELVVNYTAHPELVDKVDWYIIPVLNPDGYAHTFDPNGDRLWRKNRSPNIGTPCFGTDLNRNFDIFWDQGGSADLRCRDNYHGRIPFSEVESRNLRDAINRVAAETLVYLTFHTYGQYWLTPWGYTPDLPDDYDDLESLAIDAVTELEKVYGTEYVIGTSTNTLGVASGGSDDWAKAVAGVKYSYTVEMRDQGENGFVQPADQILPNNLEVWEGVKVVANFVASQNKKHV